MGQITLQMTWLNNWCQVWSGLVSGLVWFGVRSGLVWFGIFGWERFGLRSFHPCLHLKACLSVRLTRSDFVDRRREDENIAEAEHAKTFTIPGLGQLDTNSRSASIIGILIECALDRLLDNMVREAFRTLFLNSALLSSLAIYQEKCSDKSE